MLEESGTAVYLASPLLVTFPLLLVHSVVSNTVRLSDCVGDTFRCDLASIQFSHFYCEYFRRCGYDTKPFVNLSNSDSTKK